MTRPTAALDTSALGELLEDVARRQQFVETVQRRNAGIYISEMVIDELTSDEVVADVAARVVSLKCLFQDLGDSLFVAPDHTELMRDEGRRWLKGAPVLSIGWPALLEKRDEELSALAEGSPAAHAEMQRKKEEFLGLDRTLHEDARIQSANPNPAEVAALIESAEGLTADNMIIEIAARLSEGRFSPEQVLADQRRFLAAHTTAHWVLRCNLANAVDPAQCRGTVEQTIGLWRTKPRGKGKGAWWDALIAGAAAYMNVLVTDDRDQARRANFLADRHLVIFRAQNLDEYLGTA